MDNLKKLEKLQRYVDTIEKVIVTYKNDYKKEFTGRQWFLFEEDVSKIAKSIEVVNIKK